ncbi:MFS transporter [Nisaea acidiphila]|uniref:MFS transporter n=1 Tax=Nisaea acidiphila TaxID=1862145 RepID=A0A9J7ANU4_9PROT|nr:MFS transporter [Nisaea acidiphila]UUX48594.1 MFS transporter [Nisaea acidiphila]
MFTGKNAHETAVMSVVFMTVLVGWVGFSLPYPVFGHLFLNPQSDLLPAETPGNIRTLLLGLAIGLYPAGQIAGSMLFGRLSDRFGRAPVLAVALAVAVLGALMLWSAVETGMLWLLLLGRMVAGIGEGNIAILQSLAADVSRPKSKARNFALIGIAMDLGFVAGPIVGGLLAVGGAEWAPDYGAPFAAAAALFAANAVLVPWLLRGRVSASERRGEPGGAALEPRARRRLIALLGLSFLAFWAVMVFLEFFPVFFVQRYATPPLELGINAALLSVPLILSGLIVGRIVNRLGATAVTLLSLLMMGSGSYAFVEAGSPLGHILPAVLVAAGINFAQTATSVLISDAAPAAAQGAAIGIYRATTIAAGALVGIAGGWLSGIDPAAPFLTGVAACLLAALGLTAFAIRTRRSRTSAECRQFS